MPLETRTQIANAPPDTSTMRTPYPASCWMRRKCWHKTPTAAAKPARPRRRRERLWNPPGCVLAGSERTLCSDTPSPQPLGKHTPQNCLTPAIG